MPLLHTELQPKLSNKVENLGGLRLEMKQSKKSCLPSMFNFHRKNTGKRPKGKLTISYQIKIIRWQTVIEALWPCQENIRIRNAMGIMLTI